MIASVEKRWKAIGVLLLVIQCSVSVPWSGRLIEDNSLCPQPSCVTKEEIDTLWGYPDPNFFLQCRPAKTGYWELQLMPCAPSTWFSFRHQVCVIPMYWEACTGNEGTTVNPPTPETPTTPGTPETPSTPDTPDTPTIPDTPDTPSTPNTGGSTVDDDLIDRCNEPRCTTFVEINTLWVHISPVFFYQCRPSNGYWYPEVMPCAPGTVFSFRHQVCVFPQYWQDCGDSGTTSLPTTTSTEATVSSTTDLTESPGTTTTTEIPITTPADDTIDPCIGPRCVTYEEINTLWSHPSPNFFYQCRPLNGAWAPQEMPCAKGTLFSVVHQVCVFEQYWENTCSQGSMWMV
uniref:Chitin-binding type-2 domain-containing protein n=1 Tax=Anopheles atroparvus TaxID=41427 RepID=A0AAG5DW33_ANOAO